MKTKGMVMAEEEIHVGAERARAGVTPHVTRYVLSISLILIVIFFAALLLIWR
jgi:hypothetical protein